ncbi:family 16 glycosylhydrolase, partial [Roseovarius sp. D22-M7]|uniref:family 16 glycosylhydrolase n=1 Tax=Roseovarius sp. D22-M7 TaxID=3127116 RepID=UPI00300F993A
MPQQIFDSFDSFDADTWNRSDFAVSATWNQTAWEADYVEDGDGVLRLRLDGADKDGKPFTGAELQSEEHFTYGSFEMRLKTSGEPGTVSAFFLYTGEFFGASEQNEIDFEFLGNNPSQVSINYYYGTDKFANYIEEDIELGFDTSADFHDYRIDWTPDAIRWFADDRLFYEIRAEDAPLPIPDKDMLVYSSLWTGDANLEDWHGPVDQEIDTSMSLDSFSYTPALLSLPVDQTGAVTFAGTSESLVIDMAAGTYSQAAKVLAIGDSLTVGFVDVNDPSTEPEKLDGYRLDLFDSIVQAGGWFDYVGFLESGPDEMMDSAHSAVGGTPLRDIIRNDGFAGPVDLSDNLDAFSPDIVLFMAGTNDFNRDADIFFGASFPNLIDNIGTAIDQFLAMPDSEDAYFVVSTLAPKLKAGVPEIFADYLNHGYSTVDGAPVVGDAGNGTYQPGIIATVGARTAIDPNILLFNNPVDVSGLSPDEIHFTEAAYTEYAADLAAFLQSEIGLTGGTFGGAPQFLQPTRHLVGSDAGDRIFGTDGNDTIDGGGGADYVDGGAGADTILFGGDTLEGTLDKVAGFSIAQGDRINLFRMAEHFGWSASQTLANLVLEDVATGVRLKIDTGSTIETFAEILDQTAATIGTVIQADPLPSADDDRNLSLTAPDLFIDDTEATSVDVSLVGLDADATGVIKLTDGIYSLTRVVRSEGTYSFDISGMADGAITTSITASTASGESLTLPGDTISLAGPMPPSADDDRNLVVSAPDFRIDAAEAEAITIDVSGLDSDATAVVTASDGISTVPSGVIGADGTVTLDISSLLDGPVTTQIVATDTGGATTTTSGPTLTLDTRVDTTADEAPFLSLSAADASIDASEVGAVEFTLSGLDADATA